jgi:hypothetical protein
LSFLVLSCPSFTALIALTSFTSFLHCLHCLPSLPSLTPLTSFNVLTVLRHQYTHKNMTSGAACTLLRLGTPLTRALQRPHRHPLLYHLLVLGNM